MNEPDDPALLPAVRQLQLFRAGKLSPVDVLRSQIARAERLGPEINAITFAHFDAALAAARTSERRWQADEARALEGLTVAVKDEFDRAGWIVTAGSALLEEEAKSVDHPVIDKLLRAGAILHAQTTAPEFYLIGVTWSDRWGVTRNPWNPACTPGGSSGGSAAALAAGMATLAIGSDMGGSVRIPSALCGLYGSKPACGRIASPDASALVPHASPGPLGRELADLALLQSVMMGPAPGCPSALPAKPELLRSAGPKPRRLAFSLDQGWARIEPDVENCARTAVNLWREAGHTVEEIALPLETTDRELRETVEAALFSTAIGGSLLPMQKQRERLTTYGRRFVDLAASLGPQQANAAAEETLRLFRVIEDHVFEKGFDALICPTVATTRIAADFDPTADQIAIAGARVDPYSGWFLTSLFSLLNWMPVINVPAGSARNGVPVGLQVATRPYEDELCYEIAAAYAARARDDRRGR